MKKEKKVKEVKTPVPLKLDLGSGPHVREGFEGADIIDFGQKYVLDLRKKWPWKDNSVDEVNSAHTVEHLDSDERVFFFNELYRVLKPGAKAYILVPYYMSTRAYGDPTHKWPPISEMFWSYLNRNWRATQAPHVGYRCDFDFTYGYSLQEPWASRSEETRQFALMHYKEVAADMMATLIKKVD